MLLALSGCLSALSWPVHTPIATMKPSFDDDQLELQLRSRLHEQVILDEDLDTCPELIRYLQNLKQLEVGNRLCPVRVLHDSSERRR